MFDDLHPTMRGLMHQVRGLCDDLEVRIHESKRKGATNRKPRADDSVEFHVEGLSPEQVGRRIAATPPDRYRWGRLSVLSGSLVLSAGEDREVVGLSESDPA